MDVQKSTVEELKAFAYDQIALRDLVQNNLNIINQEIAKRQKDESTSKSTK